MYICSCLFIGLKYKSTLVRGYLTDIDRENKSIVVSDEIAMEYDVLLIASPNQGIISC
jgi:NADH dehydrogenase FAD-containing subunit